MAQLTLYPGDFPVSPSAQRENEWAARMTVSSGLKLLESLALSGPSGLYLKTLLACSAFWNQHHFLEWKYKRLSFFVRTKTGKQIKPSSVSSEESLELSSTKLGELDIYFPHLVTAHQSLCVFQLVPSAPRIAGTGYGLLPTPVASQRKESSVHWATRYQADNRRPKSPTLIVALDLLIQASHNNLILDSQAVSSYRQRTGPLSNLHRVIAKMKMGFFPTPTATDAKGSITAGGLTRKDGRTRADSLRNIPAITGLAGQLNPLFVAEMMGFPVDWTLSAFQNGATKASTPLATP